jgi:nitrate reductase delta subunit
MCDRLAFLCEYPRAAYRDAAGAAPDFAEAIAALSDTELEELYVQSFEMNPDRALEIGWHLFGEQYERGEFLVKMRVELRRYGIPETTELPDHLSQVLRLLARLPDADAAAFAAQFAAPALEKIAAALEGSGSPYERLIQAVRDRIAAPAAAGRTA